MIDVVRINIGSGGLPTCSTCAPTEAASYRPLAEIAAEAADCATERSRIVMLGGAESFGHPELPRVIDAVVSAGAERVGVETAGTLLAVGGNASGVLHAGVRHCEVRFVPGDDPDRCREHALQLDGVRELVRTADEAGVRIAVAARVPACRHTVSHLPQAVADLVAAGVGAVHVHVDGSAGSGQQTLALICAACDTGVVNAVWVDVAGVHLPSSHAMHQSQEES